MTHTKDEVLALALEALEGNTTNPVIDPDQAAIEDQAITAIKQALSAQPEPNGWAISYDGKTPYAIWPEGDGPLLDLEVKRQGGTCCKLPIYTIPPESVQRQWVGLTDEDYHTNMFSITSLGACDIATIKSIAKDVEAKLKEKNT